jgi:hypothetical protein
VCIIQDTDGGIRRTTERKMVQEGYEIYGYDSRVPEQSVIYDPVYLYGSMRKKMGAKEYADAIREFVSQAAEYLTGTEQENVSLLMNAYMAYLEEFGPISKNPGNAYDVQDLLDLLKDLPVFVIQAHVPTDTEVYLWCQKASKMSNEQMAAAEHHLKDLMLLFTGKNGKGPVLDAGLFENRCVLYISVPECRNRKNPVLSALVQQLETLFSTVFPDTCAQFWLAEAI